MSKPRKRFSSPLPFALSPLSMSLAVLFSPALLAQQSAETIELPTMQVWGTQVSSSSEYLSDQDISVKQADHLSDLLRDIPGVDVGGTHSVNQRINIRGLNETDLDIRLDGASQHASMFHHIGNLTLNPDIIQAVDVEVGNNSVSNSGLGGSVHFETKDVRDLLRSGERFGSRLYVGYGTNVYRQGSAALYGQLSENVDALLYGYKVDRDNFEDGDGNQTFGADGTITDILAKVGWGPGYGHRFELSHDHYEDEGDYSPRPDMSGSANNGLSADLVLPTEYSRDTTTLGYKFDDGSPSSYQATLYRNYIELYRDESGITSGWPGNRISENTAENTNLGATASATTRMQLASLDHRFTYGLEYNQQQSRARYGSSAWMEEQATASAVYAEDRLTLTERWSVTPGVRYDHVDRDATTGDETFDDVTWALGTEFEVNDYLTLFADARELFEAPELLETFIRYQDVAYLADDIRAESGLNKEVGARYQRDFGEHGLAANLTLFQTDIDDYIVASYNGAAARYDIFNDGDVRIEGFEASLGYGYKRFGSRISYAHSDANNRTNDTPMLDSNGLSADLGDSVSVDVDYVFEDLALELGWLSQWVLEEDNVMPGTPVKEAYDVHSLYAQWSPKQAEGITVTFGVDNLFDEQYASHASRSGLARGIDTTDVEPGRNIKASVAYQF